MNPGIQRSRTAIALSGALAFAGHAFPQITVATAASVQFTMEELKADFKKSSGIDVKTVYGASGMLSTQIKYGAPFDLFVSADMDFPDSLHKWGYAPAKAKPYAYGKLVLWTLKDLNLDSGMKALLDPKVVKIAVADPKRAPYGREAVKALLRSGAYDKLKDKLVYGENLSQVTHYILTGNVEIGFDALSVVMAGETRGKGKWKEVDNTLYDRIAQGAVVCRYGLENNPTSSAAFLAYLYSDPARAIFSKYGYGLP
ncbi:MAG: molybdate ABC transporter substrate-binding protein [Fibrobacteria bacterium]